MAFRQELQRFALGGPQDDSEEACRRLFPIWAEVGDLG